MKRVRLTVYLVYQIRFPLVVIERGMQSQEQFLIQNRNPWQSPACSPPGPAQTRLLNLEVSEFSKFLSDVV